MNEDSGIVEDVSPKHVERRLAAILAADVAGYSRLVGADEPGTLAQWWAHRDELIEPTIREHQGRVVRITGDGILAEFASVVNAVRCAIALQRGMAERNAELPTQQRMEFRAGINVGDVIIDRGEMWGEAVNMAARLEALADPGGLCVSGRVQEEVHDKLDVAFEDMGEQQFKNIARPVRVYRAHLNQVTGAGAPPRMSEKKSARADGKVYDKRAIALALGAKKAPPTWRRSARSLLFAVVVNGLGSLLVTAAWWLASSPSSPITFAAKNPGHAERAAAAAAISLPSLVALPFSNLSGDVRHDHIADGITDSLTSDLARGLSGFVLDPLDRGKR